MTPRRRGGLLSTFKNQSPTSYPSWGRAAVTLAAQRAENQCISPKNAKKNKSQRIRRRLAAFSRSLLTAPELHIEFCPTFGYPREVVSCVSGSVWQQLDATEMARLPDTLLIQLDHVLSAPQRWEGCTPPPYWSTVWNTGFPAGNSGKDVPQ